MENLCSHQPEKAEYLDMSMLVVIAIQVIKWERVKV